jgi:3-hydroxyacyl-[acyl-carrier-protein] dehydratase
MPALDLKEIMRLLPHRYPMLLVDRVLDYEAMKWIRGQKNVTANEPFFPGHFPDYPVMPGVLVIEAMAGLAKMDGSQLVLFAGIDDARFKRQVMPGDTLVLECELKRAVRGVGRFQCKAQTQAGQIVCEASMLAAVRDRPAS